MPGSGTGETFFCLTRCYYGCRPHGYKNHFDESDIHHSKSVRSRKRKMWQVRGSVSKACRNETSVSETFFSKYTSQWAPTKLLISKTSPSRGSELSISLLSLSLSQKEFFGIRKKLRSPGRTPKSKRVKNHRRNGENPEGMRVQTFRLHRYTSCTLRHYISAQQDQSFGRWEPRAEMKGCTLYAQFISSRCMIPNLRRLPSLFCPARTASTIPPCSCVIEKAPIVFVPPVGSLRTPRPHE